MSNESLPQHSPAHRAEYGVPVIICDDHIAIRAGLRQILERAKIRVAGECEDLPQLLALTERYPAAVLMTDLGVDDVPFTKLVSEVHRRAAAMPIIVYSMRETPATISLCYQEGASAFVPKRADISEIVEAVLAVGAGKVYFTREVAANLAAMQVVPSPPKEILLPRELQVFIAYAKSPNINQIAADLSVTSKTVQNTVSAISKKLDIPRNQFYATAVKHGLIDVI